MQQLKLPHFCWYVTFHQIYVVHQYGPLYFIRRNRTKNTHINTGKRYWIRDNTKKITIHSLTRYSFLWRIFYARARDLTKYTRVWAQCVRAHSYCQLLKAGVALKDFENAIPELKRRIITVGAEQQTDLKVIHNAQSLLFSALMFSFSFNKTAQEHKEQ